MWSTNWAPVFGIDVEILKKKVYTPEGTFADKALVLASGGNTGLPSVPLKWVPQFRGATATCSAAFITAGVGISNEAVKAQSA